MEGCRLQRGWGGEGGGWELGCVGPRHPILWPALHVGATLQSQLAGQLRPGRGASPDVAGRIPGASLVPTPPQAMWMAPLRCPSPGRQPPLTCPPLHSAPTLSSSQAGSGPRPGFPTDPPPHTDPRFSSQPACHLHLHLRWADNPYVSGTVHTKDTAPGLIMGAGGCQGTEGMWGQAGACGHGLSVWGLCLSFSKMPSSRAEP